MVGPLVNMRVAASVDSIRTVAWAMRCWSNPNVVWLTPACSSSLKLSTTNSSGEGARIWKAPIHMNPAASNSGNTAVAPRGFNQT